MYPELHIFGLRLPMYGLMFTVGVVTAFVCALLRAHQRKSPAQSDVLIGGIFSLTGGLLGGKLLFILTNIPSMISFYSINGFDLVNLIVERILKSGIVYYGGFIGGSLGLLCYAKLFRLKFLEISDAIILFVPLAQGFGRLGCFFGGCCYGVKTDSSFGFVFVNDSLELHRMPVQLYESMFCFFILFPIMLWFASKKRCSGWISGLYIIIYSAWRFIIEFWRGDSIRGSLGALSTSQWISLFLFPIGVILLRDWFRGLMNNDKLFSVTNRHDKEL